MNSLIVGDSTDIVIGVFMALEVVKAHRYTESHTPAIMVMFDGEAD